MDTKQLAKLPSQALLRALNGMDHSPRVAIHWDDPSTGVELVQATDGVLDVFVVDATSRDANGQRLSQAITLFDFQSGEDLVVFTDLPQAGLILTPSPFPDSNGNMVDAIQYYDADPISGGVQGAIMVPLEPGQQPGDGIALSDILFA